MGRKGLTESTRMEGVAIGNNRGLTRGGVL